MRRTVPPSAEIQAEIDKLLGRGLVDDPQKMLAELARLGARLIIQRAVEEEFDTWLGRARYERKPEAGAGEAQRVPSAAPADRGGRAADRDPAGPRGGDPVRLEAVPEVALQAAAANGPAQGAGDRRVRARPVDARCRVAVRRGRAREDLEVDAWPRSARSCTSGSRRSVAARSTTSTWSCCSSTRSTYRSARAARRKA